MIRVLLLTTLALLASAVFATPSSAADPPLSPNPCNTLGVCIIRDDTDKVSQAQCEFKKNDYVAKYAKSANTTNFTQDDIKFAVYRACFIGDNAQRRAVDAKEASEICATPMLSTGADELSIDLPKICAESYGDLSILKTQQQQKEKCTIDEKARFLTMPAWYRGVVDEKSCEINPSSVGNDNGTFLKIIAINITDIMLNIVAYASIVFVIVGGFRFITSAGAPEGRIAAISTISNSLIGLVISIVSIGIINLLAGSLF